MSGIEILLAIAIIYAISNWDFILRFGAPGNRTPLKNLILVQRVYFFYLFHN